MVVAFLSYSLEIKKIVNKIGEKCGTITGFGSNNINFNEDYTKQLIIQVGLSYARTDPPRPAPNPHNYPHVPCWTNGSIHNAIKIK